MNYRLYPTYVIEAKNFQLCGVTSSKQDDLSVEYDRTKVTHQVRRRQQARQPSDFSTESHSVPDVSSNELSIARDEDQIEQVYLLNVRFPVIKSLRTNEDTYATLMCSPDTQPRRNYDKQQQRSDMEVSRFTSSIDDIGDVWEDKNSTTAGKSSTTSRSITLMRAVPQSLSKNEEELDEPIVEESRQSDSRAAPDRIQVRDSHKSGSKELAPTSSSTTTSTTTTTSSSSSTSAITSTPNILLSMKIAENKTSSPILILRPPAADIVEKVGAIPVPAPKIASTTTLEGDDKRSLNDVSNFSRYENHLLSKTKHVIKANSIRASDEEATRRKLPSMWTTTERQFNLFVLTFVSSLVMMALIFAIIIDNLFHCT